MTKAHRIGRKRLRGARVRYNAIVRLRNRDKEKAIRAALEKLEREGDRRPDIELNGWDFVT